MAPDDLKDPLLAMLLDSVVFWRVLEETGLADWARLRRHKRGCRR